MDWNVLGRTDQLVVKVFGREEDLTVDVLVDATDSMWCGDPSKTGTARQLAAAFGYIALNSKHRLRLGVVSGGCLSLRGAYVGMESAAGYFRDLESMEAGRADAAGGLGAYLDRIRRPGAVIFLSDCLENDALTRALARLGDVAAEATLIQVLSPQDLHPAFNGAVLLSDAEESGVLALKADPSLRKKYGLRLEAYRQDLQRLCQRHTLAFHSVSSGDPLEGIVMTWFQARKAR